MPHKTRNATSTAPSLPLAPLYRLCQCGPSTAKVTSGVVDAQSILHHRSRSIGALESHKDTTMHLDTDLATSSNMTPESNVPVLGHDSSDANIEVLEEANESNHIQGLWSALIPELKTSLSLHYDRTSGQVSGEGNAKELPGICKHKCERTEVNVLCVYWDSKCISLPQCISDHKTTLGSQALPFHHCPCETLSQCLVRNGLFPTTPTEPTTAIAIDLLDLSSTLFPQSRTLPPSFSTGIRQFHAQRGSVLLSVNVSWVHGLFILTHGHSPNCRTVQSGTPFILS